MTRERLPQLTGLLVACVSLLFLSGCGRQATTSPGEGDSPLRYRRMVFPAAEVRTDLSYRDLVPPGERGSEDSWRFDLCQPEADKEQRRPLVILVHGGGYYSGDKQDLRTSCEGFAKAGYVAASINYRLFPQLASLQQRTNGGKLTAAESSQLVEAFDSAVADSRRAIKYLTYHAEEFRISPTKVAAVGVSAGGSTALGNLLTRRYDEQIFGQSSPLVSAAVVASGSIGDELRSYIAPEPPPALFIFHERDTYNSENPPKEVCVLLRERGGICKASEIKGAGHSIDIASELDEILPFLSDSLHLR